MDEKSARANQMIAQILPNMADGDAISNHALELKKLAESLGFQSEIYALFRFGKGLENSRSINEFEALPTDEQKGFSGRKRTHSTVAHSPDESNLLVVYHYSIGNNQVSNLYRKAKGKRVLMYHNITPAHFFSEYDPRLSDLLKEGRDDLRELKKHTDFSICDSEFNASELRDLGYSNVEVAPIILNLEQFKNTPADPETLRYLDCVDPDWKTFLFTGRVVPNKAPHDVIRAFAEYFHKVSRKCRLFLVGGTPSRAYLQDLHELIDALRVSAHVFIPGHIRFNQLVAYYQVADLFLCLSDHEGFCVPLLEAMYFNLPIVALKSTGVPYTLGDAGILIQQKNFEAIAQVSDLLLTQPALKEKIVLKQQARLAEFSGEIVRKQFTDLIYKMSTSQELDS